MILLAALAACVQPAPYDEANIFTDTVFVAIGELQDHRDGPGLRSYVNHPEATYRSRALLALGSVQDTSMASVIEPALVDPDEQVRIAGAFALGQMKCGESERILFSALKQEPSPAVRARLYESYGRATRHWDIHEVPADTLEAAGFAWGLFRAPEDASLTAHAVPLLSSPARSVRLAAAHFFSRKALSIDTYAAALMNAARDHDDEVRMAAVYALRKIPGASTFQFLSQRVSGDPSHRVRINALRALEAFDVNQCFPVLTAALHDENVNVALQAAEVINAHRKLTARWQQIAGLAREADRWQVRAMLFKSALALSNDDQLRAEIVMRYRQAADPWHKAMLLEAMGTSLRAFDFVRSELMNADTIPVRTAAASALAAMNDLAIGKSQQRSFATAYQEAIALGDAAVTSIVCDALSHDEYGYRAIISDWQFLYDAKAKLQSSADNEILQELEDAIAYFEKRQPASLPEAPHQAINWATVRKIPANQRARISTGKGAIEIELKVNEAPGSVANFIKLVQQGRYTNKVFHRVVPNFVAQGGCPRGDGYGGEAYTIRSEFALSKFKTGSVGLASSGKDTESAQWFITHSPTPHLDGNYTIFAEVVSGMDVVHRLEVGDTIGKIELLP